MAKNDKIGAIKNMIRYFPYTFSVERLHTILDEFVNIYGPVAGYVQTPYYWSILETENRLPVILGGTTPIAAYFNNRSTIGGIWANIPGKIGNADTCQPDGLPEPYFLQDVFSNHIDNYAVINRRFYSTTPGKGTKVRVTKRQGNRPSCISAPAQPPSHHFG